MGRAVVDSVRQHVNAVCLTFFGGIGNHIFLSTLAHELEKRGTKNVFIVSEYGGALSRTTRMCPGFAGPGSTLSRWMARLAVGGQLLKPSYLINHDPVKDKGTAPPSHILHYLCEQVGIKGEITLKPYFVPTAGEMEWGAHVRGLHCNPER